MPKIDWKAHHTNLARTRLLVLATVFMLLFMLINIRTIDLAVAHTSLRVELFSYRIVALTALTYSIGLPVLLSTIYEKILDITFNFVVTSDTYTENSIAIEMLVDKINKALLGKILLMCLLFCSTILFIFDYFRSVEIVIIALSATFTINSLSNELLIARRIRGGTFPDCESDARAILEFITTRKNSADGYFDGRPLSPSGRRKESTIPDGHIAIKIGR